jgi:hypothetical protein
MPKNGHCMIQFNISTYAHSIHAVGVRASPYSIYLIFNEFYPRGPRLGRKPAVIAKARPTFRPSQAGTSLFTSVSDGQ